ncbi:MAG: hypothetical protein K8U03_04650 [Planctomycetia bacterium]|nr:hypothetical protein [Planctomycetia bacterium]
MRKTALAERELSTYSPVPKSSKRRYFNILHRVKTTDKQIRYTWRVVAKFAAEFVALFSALFAAQRGEVAQRVADAKRSETNSKWCPPLSRGGCASRSERGELRCFPRFFDLNLTNAPYFPGFWIDFSPGKL